MTDREYHVAPLRVAAMIRRHRERDGGKSIDGHWRGRERVWWTAFGVRVTRVRCVLVCACGTPPCEIGTWYFGENRGGTR